MSDDFDLYEFPKGHLGRKSYVTVVGHVRSVPRDYTYHGADGHAHVLPEYGGDGSGFANGTAMIMRDMSAYVSPLDGETIVHSRSAHRDHMRQHGVIEVGTEKIGWGKRNYSENAPMQRAGADIVRAMRELQGR